MKILIFNKPDLIFGMGGYSSFPFCLAAILLRIPLILYENNLHLGKANKYLTPFAKKLFVSHKELDGVPKKYLYKIRQIGNIIREEILNYDNSKTPKNDQGLKILILGGSQAAKIFAEKIPYIFEECVRSKISLAVYQQCLPEQNKNLSNIYQKLKINYELFNFKENIGEYFPKVNLAFTRAGSSMLAELINARIPFISIPLPSSADNHQYKNAMFYKKKGFCFIIEEEHLDTKLLSLIKELNDDISILTKMKITQGQYSDKTVYENIERELENI